MKKSKALKAKPKSGTRKKKAKPAPALVKHKAVTGPLHSRRLGLSLMVNLGTRPQKRCTWNCIYCPYKTTKNPDCQIGIPMPKRETVLAELAIALAKSKKNIDSVVLGGTSEPTVHPDFPEIVQDILGLRKELKAKWQVNCISTGSALGNEKIRKACDSVDRMWIKLDCATDELFRNTNHPAEKQTTVEKRLELIGKLRKPLIQTTFWRHPTQSELQNWSAENLLGLLSIYERLKPSCVHLTTLRPASVFAKLRPIYYENLEAFALRVGELGIQVEVFP